MRRSVTMADVAREAGVSRQLVSLVIRDTGYVSPEKRMLVEAAAARLGYRRNDLAASLASRRTGSIGFAVLDVHNQVYADLVDGVSDVLQPAGYQVLLATGAYPGEGLSRSIGALVGLRVDGILIASHLNDDVGLERLLSGTPAVTMGEGTRISVVDGVRGNDELGARLAAEHLLAQGYQDIAFIGGPATQQGEARRVGYRLAMTSARRPARESDADATEAGGAKAMRSLLNDGGQPEAVICYNDSTAIGVLTCARLENIRIPEDMAVVGYDNTRVAGYPGIDLTSVDPDARAMGMRAAALLLDRIADPDRSSVTEVLTPRLVIRRSSDRPRLPKLTE